MYTYLEYTCEYTCPAPRKPPENGELHLVHRKTQTTSLLARGERILAGVVYVVSNTRDTMGKDNRRLIGSLRAKVYAPGQEKFAPGFPTSSASTCNLAMQTPIG